MGSVGRALAVAVAALAAVPAGAASPRGALDVAVEVGATSASIAWHASAPVEVRVEHGRDSRYGLWTRASADASGASVHLEGLEPATTYAYRVVDRSGRVLRTGRLTTRPAVGRRAAGIAASTLQVDGAAVFPRMVFRDCPWNFPASLDAGINLFMGSCEGDRALIATLNGRALAVPAVSARRDGPGVIGWHHADEADLHVRPEHLPRLPPAAQTGRVTFLTLSSHVWDRAAPGPLPRSLYPAMIARTDVVGVTVYPLASWCRKTFSPVNATQRHLATLAHGKPTFQWIEAAVMGDLPCARYAHLHPTADTVRAETWLAIAGGARGIGYFPATTWTPAVRAEITRINRDIVALAPALLAPSRPVEYGLKSPVHVGARVLNGAVYAIAVNSSIRPTTRSFSLPGVKATAATVWGENRSVPVRNGKIVDAFDPLGRRIYIIAPA